MEGNSDRAYTVTYENRFGRTRRYDTNFEGALPWLERRYADSESDAVRESYQQFMREVPCRSCHGGRLNPISLAVTVGGLSIAELSGLSLAKASARPRRPRTVGSGRADRRTGDQGDPGQARLPPQRRARLPDAHAFGRHTRRAVRRSASGWRRRSVPVWWVFSTSSTSRRSACTSATTSV